MPLASDVAVASHRRPRITRLVAGLGLLTLALQAPSVFASPGLGEVPPHVLQRSAGADSGTVYAEIWQPRSRTGAIHLHGGVFMPMDADATSATLGARLGINLADPVLLGVLTGWTYSSKRLLEPVDSGLPGFEPEVELASVQAHLIPAMAFLQVTLTQKFPIAPYVGIGAGYEWLVLHAQDHRVEADTSVTYGNWAWTWYAGAGLRLSDGVRVDGEVFYNDGTLGRDVTDASGATRRELVDADGVGARVGLHIIY